jgi:hypothetical protein
VSDTTAGETRWRRSGAVLWRRTNTEVLFLLAESDDPIGVLGSGAFVWDVLEHPSTASETTQVLCALFEADPSRIRRDVEQLLGHLESIGVVEREPSTP